MNDLISLKYAAERFGVTTQTVRKWRARFDDFPKPALSPSPHYHLYQMSDLWDWYVIKWPERVGRLEMYLHRFVIEETGLAEVTTSLFGPTPESRGYLKAIRDLQYTDWKFWYTATGFVAEKDATTHIWALDPSEEPEDWFIYEQRYKAVGRREK